MMPPALNKSIAASEHEKIPKACGKQFEHITVREDLESTKKEKFKSSSRPLGGKHRPLGLLVMDIVWRSSEENGQYEWSVAAFLMQEYRAYKQAGDLIRCVIEWVQEAALVLLTPTLNWHTDKLAYFLPLFAEDILWRSCWISWTNWTSVHI